MNSAHEVRDCSSAEALRSACLWLVATSILLAAAMASFTRLRVSFEGAEILACILGVLLISSMALNSRWPRAADGLGAAAQAWLGGLAACATAVAGLRLGLPVRDPALLAIDRFVGIDGAAVLDWTWHQPAWFVHLLSVSYGGTVAALFVSMLLLALLGDRLEVWRAAMCFVGSVVTTCLIAAVTPAVGMSTWVSPEFLARLPSGPARHFWPRFERFHDFHDGATAALRLDSLGAAVTFPSFHTIMGLIVAAMWRTRRAAFVPACIWLSLMLFSTLPFGGHYLVDLIGGTAVWGLWFAASKRLERDGPVRFPRLMRLRFASNGAGSPPLKGFRGMVNHILTLAS
jgi:hypothetical protein